MIQDSGWTGQNLTFRYTIRSNDTHVVSTITGFDGDLLAGTWRLEDNTNSGEFKYKKILDIAPPIEIVNDTKQTRRQPVARVYRVQGETVTITSAVMSKIGMHDTLYVLVDNQKVYLKVIFPMVTIARCKPTPGSKIPASKINAGMTVYR